MCNLCVFPEGNETAAKAALQTLLDKSITAMCNSALCDIALFVLPVEDHNGAFALKHYSTLWLSLANTGSAFLVLWIEKQEQIKNFLHVLNLEKRVFHFEIGGHGEVEGQVISLRHGNCQESCIEKECCPKHSTGLRSQ